MSGVVFQAGEVNSSGLELSIRVLSWVRAVLCQTVVQKLSLLLAELSWVESLFLETASLLC